MSSDAPAPKRKLPILPLAVLGVIGLVAVALILRGVDPRALMERGITMIRDAGAPVFFLAMTLLPAVGVPMMAFTMTAGEAFEPQLGLSAVIVISLLAVGINLALGYWVARYALRPVLTGLLKRYGYGVPRVTKENALTVTMLVRLTPGPPYALQACVLGLAEVPFRLYLLVSWLAMVPWTLGAIILGKGLFSGKFGMAASGMGVLVVALILVQVVRRKLAKRKAVA
jgi:uncharacterized membrane protein YdjX (TVP38/TMEM64 family)